jgi:hypothetical protein
MKKHKVPKIYKTDIHRIPACGECGEDMVKFRGAWVCNDCMKIPVKLFIGQGPVEISFGELFLNRKARREK